LSDFPSIDLSVLTARQREVIEMRYSCCLSQREVAEFLGISRRSVRGRHDRAIQRLREANTPTKHILVGGSCAEPLKASASRPG